MGKSGNPAKRAQQEAAQAEPVTYDRADAADEYGTEDFDAFWSARDRKHRRTRIRGHVVDLPASLPLQFEMEARRLEKSKDFEDVKRLVGILVGPDALAAWIKSGLDAEQFGVLLAWLPQVITLGDDAPTLAEVAAKLDALEDNTVDPR